MNKCEWVGTKSKESLTEWRFKPCDSFSPIEIGCGLIRCQSCSVDINRPEPEERSDEEINNYAHQDIMNRWWRKKRNRIWFKVFQYNEDTKKYLALISEKGIVDGKYFDVTDFRNMESKEIPTA